MAIDQSFGIRCPVGIQLGDSDSVYVNDFENDCQSSDEPDDTTAFCGKCAASAYKYTYSNNYYYYSFNLYSPSYPSYTYYTLTNNYVMIFQTSI